MELNSPSHIKRDDLSLLVLKHASHCLCLQKIPLRFATASYPQKFIFVHRYNVARYTFAIAKGKLTAHINICISCVNIKYVFETSTKRIKLLNRESAYNEEK